jgi:3-oxoacyl-[acyl-carrier-protein] synthase III
MAEEIHMRSVVLLATGAHLPGEAITNEQLERVAGSLPDEVLEGIQVKSRHWVADLHSGEQSETNSQMAAKAARQALARAEVELREVDLLVVSTASPEYHLPPSATLVQEHLGLRKCAAIDIRSGCAGAVEALDLARLYLERGDFDTALVIGSETISPLTVPVFLGQDPDRVRMRDRLGIYNFGDGAGAMVLRADEQEGIGMLGSAICSMGGDRKPGMQVIGGGTHAPIANQLKAKRLIELKVDVVESGRFTPYVLTEALSDTLARCDIAAEAIDVCVIPEGNAGYMTDELREAGLLTPEWLALEHKIFENLSLVGATGSAAVPLAVDYAWTTGRVKAGEMMMILAIETSKWKYAGMVLPWTAQAISAAPSGDAGAIPA